MRLNLIKQQKLWWAISLFAFIFSIVMMAVSWTKYHAPLRPGLDFVGGTRIQLELSCVKENNCNQPIETASVQAILTEENLAGGSVQVIDNYTLSVRTQTLNTDQRSKLVSALQEKIGKFNPESIQIDTVGPSIGKELFSSGLLAIIISFGGISLYLAIRFQWDYAFFAIVALFHDVFITAGVFAMLGLTMDVEADSLFVVAILTIIGFSVNDTVVIYDRIRETMEVEPSASINQVVEDGVNQTLTRSINTSLTALLPLIAIFFFGGETLKNFSLALIIGFTLGAYSSIFIASTLLALWRNFKNVSSSPQNPEIASLTDS